MKKKIVSILFFTISFFFIACNKNTGSGSCEEALTIENASGLELHIKDTTRNRFIYDKIQPIYKLDSLEVWDNQGKRYKIFTNDASDTSPTGGPYSVIGVFGLYDSRYDGNFYNDTIRKSIFIKYKYNDWDTLNISYKAIEGICGSQFSFLQVIHRKKVISLTQNKFNPKILIKK